MSSQYLLKTEPSEYSFANLQRDKTTSWTACTSGGFEEPCWMKPGDKLIIYETGDRKSAVGTASVVSVDASNSKNPSVEIKAGKPLPKPIPLSEIKSKKLFENSPLVRIGRLSVVSLTEAQYAFLSDD